MENKEKTSTENLKYTKEFFSPKFLQQLLITTQVLNEFKDNFNKEVEGKDLSAQKIEEIGHKYVYEIMQYLDKQKIWEYRFSTENTMLPEKELKTSKNDSIYYISDNNVSLRIKRDDLVFGLNRAINSFSEKTIFISPDEKEISLTPK